MYNIDQGEIGEYACVLKAHFNNVSSMNSPRRAVDILIPAHSCISVKVQFKQIQLTGKEWDNEAKRENESP